MEILFMRKTPLMVALQAIIVFSMTNLPGNAIPLPMMSDPATRIINLKVQAAVLLWLLKTENLFLAG